MSLTDRFKAAFRGSDLAHGQTTIGKTRRNGKTDAKSYIVKQPLTKDLIEEHLKGTKGVGSIPINDKNLCNFGVLDIDTYPIDHLEVLKKSRKLKLPLVVCRSKSGGAHLFLFMKTETSASEIRDYLGEMSAALGYAGCEIFPKQDRILAERGDVVVVTLNHRLNGLGYSYLAGLSDDPKYADSGNLGSLDIVKALEWVRDHADQIGGDAGNVTIFGESGGAAKVSTLMGMEQAKGLFQRAIAQSGSMSLAGFTPRLATPLAKDLMATAGVSSVEELAAMPIDDFVEAMMKSRSKAAFYRPVVDGRSLTRQPYAPDANPVSADIPLLVGTNNNEMRLQGGLGSPENFALTWEQLPAKLTPFVDDADVGEIIAGMRKAHPDYDASDVFFQVATFRNYRNTALRQAERKSAQAAPVYMYRLDWKTPVEGGRLETPHALDIAFVFDNVARSLSYTGPETAQTKRMADLMADAWIAFARTGNPNTAALPQWPAYNVQQRATMIFDVDPEVVNDPDSAERELLQRLLPEGRSL